MPAWNAFVTFWCNFVFSSFFYLSDISIPKHSYFCISSVSFVSASYIGICKTQIYMQVNFAITYIKDLFNYLLYLHSLNLNFSII